MVGEGLAWKVGNGEKLRIGIDPWVGWRENFRLPPELIEFININGRITLNQVADNDCSSFSAQGWANANQLNLPIEFTGQWQTYTAALNVSHVCLRDREDSLFWVHSPLGEYSPKAGYMYIIDDRRP